MAQYKMYTTTQCGACKLVKASGVVDELNMEVINIDEHPELRPDEMQGAPYFIKTTLTEGGSVKTKTFTGYANAEMLSNM